MKSRNSIWTSQNIYDFGTGMANVLIGLACLILIADLVIAIFGHKFTILPFILHGSWIITAFILRYVSKYLRDKMRMKKYKWAAFTA